MEEHEKDAFRLSNGKTVFEIVEIHERTLEMRAERQWSPLVVGSGATLAIVAITKLFL
ncbi:MAG: hypothetical protein ACU0CO_05445 [Shimia sp.]